MRQKAEKLEKGKWYADSCPDEVITFLKFHHFYHKKEFFSDQKKYGRYKVGENGLIGFIKGACNRFIPTQEDREKYSLVDDE